MSVARTDTDPMVCTCGLPMSLNPHPQAGNPSAVLDIGPTWVCIPCTIKTRHRWAQRALRAEADLAHFQEVRLHQVKG